MTKAERAAQIWPLLAYCASGRQLLTYDLVGRCIGVPRHGLGHLLEPIQSYCLLEQLPALTALVVSAVDGAPGEGFIAAEDVPKEQASVFGFDWLMIRTPEPHDFAEAVDELPSAGRRLVELKSELSGRGT